MTKATKQTALLAALATLFAARVVWSGGGGGPVFDPVRHWDFEEGTVGGWQAYDNWAKPSMTVTDESLSGKRSLNLKFDDTSTSQWFDKGFMIPLDPPLLWADFNSVSFRYRIDKPVANVRVFFAEDDRDWWGYEDDKPVIGQPAEFFICRDKLHLEWSDNKESRHEMTGKAVSMYVSVHNSQPVNSKIKFSFTVDDIVLGYDLCREPFVVPVLLERPRIAAAARARRSIVVDGKLDDWPGAVPISLVSPDQVTIEQEGDHRWAGRSDLGAVLMTLWDDEHLSFAASVEDDKVVCDDPETNYDLSRNDSVRLCLRTELPLPDAGGKLGRKDFIFCMTPVSPKGPTPQVVLCGYGGEAHADFPLKDVRLASARTPGGYIIEMSIPWRDLSFEPREGARLGFYGIVDDSDHPKGRDHEIVWRKVGGSYWMDPAAWGRLVLTRPLADAELLCAAGNTGSLSPSSDRTEYEMNQDVHLFLDLWTPLPAVTGSWSIVSPVGKPAAGRITQGQREQTPLGARLVAKWDCGTNDDGAYTVTCRAGTPPVSLAGSVKLIGASVVTRLREIAHAKAALRKLQLEIAQGKIGARGKSWLLKDRLQGRPGPAWVERVDPAKWSQVKDPVKWEDLGGEFQGLAQCGLDPNDLDTFFMHYDFGRVIKPHFAYFLDDNWKRRAEDAAHRNLIVTSVWGYVPGYKDWEYKIPDERHEGLLRILGRHFFGYEIGEQDGRFIGSIAPNYKPTFRQEAQKLFWDWHEKELHVPMHHYLVALGSLNYSHQYGAMGCYRTLGLEVAQGLPSDIMEWAFLRGACKQYGLLSWNCISIYNRWGYRSYTGSGADHGPDKGTSVSLMKRLYYVTFLYGASTVGFESAYFTAEKDAEGFPKLSPVGEENVRAVQWCRKHARDAGVQYTPVAFLTDHASGWQPPRQLYSGQRYLVWGNMPYDKGDYQMDNVFRWVWPQYEDGSYFKDERGFLTATPFGDKFDVLTSECPEHILTQYPVIALLGELELTPDLTSKLKRYVANGGDLIVSAKEAKALGTVHSGVQVTDKMRRGHGALSLADRRAFDENDYVYPEVTPKGAKVVAVSEDALPLITVLNSGKGRVIAVMPDYWMTARLKVEDDPNDASPPVHPQRYELLKVVQHVLGQYLLDWDFVRVSKPGVQFIVNVARDPKRLVVALVNNSQADWQGEVSLRKGRLLSAREWIEDKEVALLSSSLSVMVPKGDLRVLELRSDAAVFQPNNAAPGYNRGEQSARN